LLVVGKCVFKSAILSRGPQTNSDLQNFELFEILPTVYTMAVTVVVPSILAQSRNAVVLQRYGTLGELLMLGSIGAIYAATL
jgi:hypothetical protein